MVDFESEAGLCKIYYSPNNGNSQWPTQQKLTNHQFKGDDSVEYKSS